MLCDRSREAYKKGWSVYQTFLCTRPAVSDDDAMSYYCCVLGGSRWRYLGYALLYIGVLDVDLFGDSIVTLVVRSPVVDVRVPTSCHSCTFVVTLLSLLQSRAGVAAFAPRAGAAAFALRGVWLHSRSGAFDVLWEFLGYYLRCLRCL